MTTAERIFALLQQSNMEQKDLAARLEITDKTVSAWRTCRSQSYVKYLPKIAEILGVTVDELFQGEGERMNTVEMMALTKAMMEFSLRVLNGKECTPQETAILPVVLSLLLVSKQSH